jgi:hypothetical protein
MLPDAVPSTPPAGSRTLIGADERRKTIPYRAAPSGLAAYWRAARFAPPERHYTASGGAFAAPDWCAKAGFWLSEAGTRRPKPGGVAWVVSRARYANPNVGIGAHRDRGRLRARMRSGYAASGVLPNRQIEKYAGVFYHARLQPRGCMVWWFMLT